MQKNDSRGVWMTGAALLFLACGSPPELEDAVGSWRLDRGVLSVPGISTIDFLTFGITSAHASYTVTADGTPELRVVPGIGFSSVACRGDQSTATGLRGPASAAHVGDSGEIWILAGDWSYEQTSSGESLRIDMTGTVTSTDGTMATVNYVLRAFR